jgi:hypothetical protein
MPDQRLFDLGQRVQDAVEFPDFESLRGRGRRLVRTRLLAAAFAVTVLVTGAVAIATSGAVDSSPPVVDVPLGRLTPEQVVQHPGAELESFAVDPDDPDVRSAVWVLPCEAVSNDDAGRPCGSARRALAVTGDGFESATYVGLRDNSDYPPRAQPLGLQALGDGHFYLADPDRKDHIVDAVGNLTQVTMSMRPAPLGDGEVFVKRELGFDIRGGTDATGVDVEAARAHVLQGAPGSYGDIWQSSDETLWNYDATPGEVVTSNDGGATWSQPLAIPSVRSGLAWIPSGSTDTFALKYDRGSLVRSTDGGRTWNEIDVPSDILTYAHWIVVRPDGSLLMQNFDGRVYASDGADWTVATPIEPGLPDSVEWDYGPETYAHVAAGADGSQTVYALGASDQAVWASTDGSHWEQTPAR